MLGWYGAHSTVSPTADSPTHCRMIFDGPRCFGGNVRVGSRLLVSETASSLSPPPISTAGRIACTTHMIDMTNRSRNITNSTSGGKSFGCTTRRFVNASGSDGHGAMLNLSSVLLIHLHFVILCPVFPMLDLHSHAAT